MRFLSFFSAFRTGRPVDSVHVSLRYIKNNFFCAVLRYIIIIFVHFCAFGPDECFYFLIFYLFLVFILFV